MSRFGKIYRTFFIEEFVFSGDVAEDYLATNKDPNSDITVVTPILSEKNNDPIAGRMVALLDQFIMTQNISQYITWYYSPLALEFTQQLSPLVTVYDCMDELSAFKGAAPEIPRYEQLLMKAADLVFTGGNALYAAKRNCHPSVHSFPSSIDKEHFMKAREKQPDFPDQANIPYPRLGFFGVLDERFDIELVERAAAMQPGWHFILVGPVVKIDPATLPQGPNIHYLGSKSYRDLPTYLANWNIAFIPFARNESTRYISPTKTPEFLAGGKPVIATPIEDIIKPYGDQDLVRIADTPEEFVQEATSILSDGERDEWLDEVDEFLTTTSWDKTFSQMNTLIQEKLGNKKSIETKNSSVYV